MLFSREYHLHSIWTYVLLWSGHSTSDHVSKWGNPFRVVVAGTPPNSDTPKQLGDSVPFCPLETSTHQNEPHFSLSLEVMCQWLPGISLLNVTVKTAPNGPCLNWLWDLSGPLVQPSKAKDMVGDGKRRAARPSVAASGPGTAAKCIARGNGGGCLYSFSCAWRIDVPVTGNPLWKRGFTNPPCTRYMGWSKGPHGMTKGANH